jgi:hypothetical protein
MKIFCQRNEDSVELKMMMCGDCVLGSGREGNNNIISNTTCRLIDSFFITGTRIELLSL